MKPDVAPDYEFRPLTQADLPRVARWLAEPHVARWRGERDKELAGIAAHIDGIAVEPFIMELDGKPIGYIQSRDPYLEDGDNPFDDRPLHNRPLDNRPFDDQPFGTLGIDQFIGEPSLIGLGHGPRLIAQFARMMFEEGAPRLIATPARANGRAIRAYEKAGFLPLGPRLTPDGEAMLMVLGSDEDG